MRIPLCLLFVLALATPGLAQAPNPAPPAASPAPVPAAAPAVVPVPAALVAACARNDPQTLRDRMLALHGAADRRVVVLEQARGTPRSDLRTLEVTVLHAGLAPFLPGTGSGPEEARNRLEREAWGRAFYEVMLVPTDGGTPVIATVQPPRPDDTSSNPNRTRLQLSYTTASGEADTGWTSFGRRWIVHVLPCVRGADGNPYFAPGLGISEPILVTSRLTGLLTGAGVALLVVILAGIGAGVVNAWQFEKSPENMTPLSPFARFNPVVICQDAFGYASIARFQVFLFTVALLGLYAYAFVMTGRPPGINDSVLILAGITLAGSAAGAAATRPVVKEAEHRLWLIGTGVLSDARRIPRFTDFFTGEGAVDITRLQVMGFTCFAVVALIYNGHTDLANYVLPSQLNTLIGLSQITYVGGKAIPSDALNRLNDELRALIQAETDALIERAGPGAGAAPGLKQAEFERKRDGIRAALRDVYGVKLNEQRLASLQPGERKLA